MRKIKIALMATIMGAGIGMPAVAEENFDLAELSGSWSLDSGRTWDTLAAAFDDEIANIGVKTFRNASVSIDAEAAEITYWFTSLVKVGTCNIDGIADGAARLDLIISDPNGSFLIIPRGSSAPSSGWSG